MSYIDETQDIRIIPLGKKPVSMQSKLSKKNIVYVPTNSFNLYEPGILRNLPNNLSNIQLEILNYIDTINNQNYKFTVKAFKGATINNSHFLLDSDKYNNLNFETQITLSDLLSKSIPGLIILDYPSTPLCEIIHLPIQIILHTDPVNPFTDDALKILNKRVHVCSSIDQIKSSIKCYLNNTLEHKNNDEYYRRYINPVH